MSTTNKLKKLIPQKLKNYYHFIKAHYYSTLYQYPANDLEIIGITGTDGKTTTTSILHHILSQTQTKKTGLITSIKIKYGSKTIPSGLHVTSPNPQDLQKLLKYMVEKKIKYVALETTSHGLDQHRVAGIKYTGAIFTNVTKEHLDYHKTFRKYLETKSKLIDKVKKNGFIVLNKDDPSYEYLNNKAKRLNKKIITYSIENPQADLYVDKINSKTHEFTLIYRDESYNCKINLPGKYNISNTLGALAATVQLGIPIKKGIEGLISFKPPEGRWNLIQKQPFKVIIDFAHTPNALKKALITARNQTENKVIVVFGCAGERDFYKRPEMGKIAGDKADITIITAEDPRSEDINKINKQIEQGLLEKNEIPEYYLISNRRKAIQKAISLAKKGDLVLITGKGHEKSMNLDGNSEIPWSDHKVAKEALKKV